MVGINLKCVLFCILPNHYKLAKTVNFLYYQFSLKTFSSFIILINIFLKIYN